MAVYGGGLYRLPVFFFPFSLTPPSNRHASNLFFSTSTTRPVFPPVQPGLCGSRSPPPIFLEFCSTFFLYHLSLSTPIRPHRYRFANIFYIFAPSFLSSFFRRYLADFRAGSVVRHSPRCSFFTRFYDVSLLFLNFMLLLQPDRGCFDRDPASLVC